ncbi:hypothetical protein MUB23_01180 [Cuneatibacter sp. NSJ-177]|uniref:hypothetical protein n=1 Tax=Cuneatibacter sp. NSJ-177 TaxID=2931401 RepID=UPI001FD0F586|nr:hypothetical protein [Cuneatibacter sp. NSJ-177]MCJ7834007.1 hypothetical protein [Cuneatibacter sp. NSJ-177]
MNEYKNKEWIYKLGNGKIGIFLSFVIVVPLTALTLWLYKSNNLAFIFAGFIDFLAMVVMLIAIYRAFAFKVLVGNNEIYYQTRLGRGNTYSFSSIRGVWISSSRGEYYCTFKLDTGKAIKIPFYTNDYQAIEFFKNQVDGRNKIYNEEGELDYYEITGKNYGISYIVGATVILFIIFILEFFVGRLPIIQEPLILRYMGIIACIFAIAILFVRYKYLDVKIDREGFRFQTGPFNKKYYKYTDIVSCKEITKRIRTGRYKAGGTTFYRDYFLFTDKESKTRKFQYEKHLYNYEIYILKKRINDANGIRTDEYVEDESMIQEEFSVEDLSDDEKVNVDFSKKRKGRGLVLKAIIVLLFLAFAARAIWPVITGERLQQSYVLTEKLMDHLEARELLEQRGFNTVDMPTSYWFFDEDKLMYVASGEKGDSKIEFYEYSDSETTDGVYNRISYDFNQNLESKERAKYERELKQGGKIFEMNIRGIYNMVAFRDNTVVYGRCLEQDRDEIVKIVEEMGYQ